MYNKIVKSGLAVTEHHLKLIDENLHQTNANSRNDFVEQAIEFYIGCLNAEDSSDYIGELLSAELYRRIFHFTKLLGPTCIRHRFIYRLLGCVPKSKTWYNQES